jgi:hypothetical protein
VVPRMGSGWVCLYGARIMCSHAHSLPPSSRQRAGFLQVSVEDVQKEVAKLRGELSAARAKLSGLEATRLGQNSKSASALKEVLGQYDSTHTQLTGVRSALQHIHQLVSASGALDNSAQFQGAASGPSHATPPPLERNNSAPPSEANDPTTRVHLGSITFNSPEDIFDKFSVRARPVPSCVACASEGAQKGGGIAVSAHEGT